MADNCDYELKAVSKDESVLKRLVKIMKYEDDEFFINRCFNAFPSEIAEEDGYFTIEIYGDCAWGCDSWFSPDGDDPSQKIVTGRDTDGKDVYGEAHYTSLSHLAKTLGVSIELFSQEPGNMIQQHAVANSSGSFIKDVGWCGWSRSELEDMTEEELAETGIDDIDDAKYGYGDDYGVYMKPSKIAGYYCPDENSN